MEITVRSNVEYKINKRVYIFGFISYNAVHSIIIRICLCRHTGTGGICDVCIGLSVLQNYTPQLFGNASITSCEPIAEALSKRIGEAGHQVETVVIGGDYTQNDGQKEITNPRDMLIFGDNLQYQYGNNPLYSYVRISSYTILWITITEMHTKFSMQSMMW